MNEQERLGLHHAKQTYFGNMTFTQEEHSAIQAALRQRLGREFISQRPGPGNQKLTYIEGHKAVALANEVFGYDGWSVSVLVNTIDFVDERAGRYTVGAHSIVRVMLKNGASQEDVGYGAAENVRSKTAAVEKARKEAVTDGMKRALRRFGNALGNCLSDKDYLNAAMKTTKPAKTTYNENDLKHETVDQDISNARKASLPSPTQGLPFTTPQGRPLPQAYSTPLHTAMPPPWEGNGTILSEAADSRSRQIRKNPANSRSASCGQCIVPSMGAGPVTSTGPNTSTRPSTSTITNTTTGASTSAGPNSVPNTSKGLISNSDPSKDVIPNTSRGPKTDPNISAVSSTNTVPKSKTSIGPQKGIGPNTSMGPNTSNGPDKSRGPGTSRGANTSTGSDTSIRRSTSGGSDIIPTSSHGHKKGISPSKKRRASPRRAAQIDKTTLDDSDEAARLRKYRQWQKQQEFRQQLARRHLKQDDLPRATTPPRRADGASAGTSGNGVELEGFEEGMDDSLLANVAENEFWSEDENGADVTPTGVMTRSRTPRKHGGQGESATLQLRQEVHGQRQPVVSRECQQGWSAQNRQPTVKKRRIDSS
ncbi:uncharacterized protein LOC144869115 isoform X2 [Branchiostoma floridae x Branchiostoma japonicum]